MTPGTWWVPGYAYRAQFTKTSKRVPTQSLEDSGQLQYVPLQVTPGSLCTFVLNPTTTSSTTTTSPRNKLAPLSCCRAFSSLEDVAQSPKDYYFCRNPGTYLY
eukprot:958677-Rhodomonas_salina.1